MHGLRENLEPNVVHSGAVKGLWGWVILDVWGLWGKKENEGEEGEEGEGRIRMKEYPYIYTIKPRKPKLSVIISRSRDQTMGVL